MQKIIYATILSFVIIFVQGCSPIYKTNYIYHPVKSEKGQKCANDCIKNKQTCHSQCFDLQRQCERDANKYAIASELIKDQSVPSTISSTRLNLVNDCYKQLDSCELACDQNHKLCHENCGGEVTIQTVCIKNCEKK